MLTQAQALEILASTAADLGRRLDGDTLLDLVPWLVEPERTPRRLRGRTALTMWRGYRDDQRARALILNSTEHRP